MHLVAVISTAISKLASMQKALRVKIEQNCFISIYHAIRWRKGNDGHHEKHQFWRSTCVGDGVVAAAVFIDVIRSAMAIQCHSTFAYRPNLRCHQRLWISTVNFGNNSYWMKNKKECEALQVQHKIPHSHCQKYQSQFDIICNLFELKMRYQIRCYENTRLNNDMLIWFFRLEKKNAKIVIHSPHSLLLLSNACEMPTILGAENQRKITIDKGEAQGGHRPSKKKIERELIPIERKCMCLPSALITRWRDTQKKEEICL